MSVFILYKRKLDYSPKVHTHFKPSPALRLLSLCINHSILGIPKQTCIIHFKQIQLFKAIHEHYGLSLFKSSSSLTLCSVLFVLIRILFSPLPSVPICRNTGGQYLSPKHTAMIQKVIFNLWGNFWGTVCKDGDDNLQNQIHSHQHFVSYSYVLHTHVSLHKYFSVSSCR